MEMKKFLESHKFYDENGIKLIEDIPAGELGVFFWERGGKQFVEMAKKHFDDDEIPDTQMILDIIEDDSESVIENYDTFEDGGRDLQDFLDCVDCLGEAKVKELIKGVK